MLRVCREGRERLTNDWYLMGDLSAA
jgi:hypothetical protein